MKSNFRVPNTTGVLNKRGNSLVEKKEMQEDFLKLLSGKSIGGKSFPKMIRYPPVLFGTLENAF